MNRKLGTLLLLAVVALLTGISQADQITLGPSSSGSVMFRNVGGVVDISFTGCGGGPTDCIRGVALDSNNAIGTYKMVITGGTPSLGTPTNGDFPVNMNGATLTLTVSIGSGHLTALGTLTDLTGANTVAPEFLGDFQITSSTFSAFPVGFISQGDFTVSIRGGNTTRVAFVDTHSGSSTHGPLSSGELLSTPEPGSLMLLGSGILGLAGVLRRKLSV
jgi:ribosomal protein S6E (S10)